MNRLFAALCLWALGPHAWAETQTPSALESDADKINYSVGFRVGSDFRDQGDGLDADFLVQGIQDAVSGAEPLMAPEEMRGVLAELQRKLLADIQAKRQKELEGFVAEGKAFLAENGKQDGVVTLPSGLQYRVIEPGTGKTPTTQDRVTVDYRGSLIDGTEFDSSYQRGEPATFQLEGVIPGWIEALQLMKEGAHWQLFVPPGLAYGDQGKLAGRTLLFEVKLLAVSPGGSQVESAPEPGAPSPSTESKPGEDER